MLRVTPIYGSSGHHPSSRSPSLPPSSTLIEYGGVRVVVNVGWDESYHDVGGKDGTAFPPSSLPEADVILLTDSSLQSLGGLPIYFGHNSRQRRSSDSNDTNEDGTSRKLSGSGGRRQTEIYATFPTVKMGQMTLYDHHANTSLDGSNPIYSLEDVDSLFTSISNSNSNHKIQTLKYAQTLLIKDPATSKPALGITPHKAGHLVGASYYILKRIEDETEVVVAPIFHHAKEKHLDSSSLYKFGTACDVLVTCCGGPGGVLGSLYSPLRRADLYPPAITITPAIAPATHPPPIPIPGTTSSNNPHNPPLFSTSHIVAPNTHTPNSTSHTPKKPILNPPSVGRDEGELVESILSTLRRNGNVLLPVDASGRVLELLLLLNQHWERHRLGSAYNLAWVGHMNRNAMDFARSQLEWMAGSIGREFDSRGGHPFQLRSVSIYSTVAEMEEALFEGGKEDHNPTCVLASGASLDCGPARDLFLKWAENSDNAVILTDSRRCVLRGKVVAEHRYRRLCEMRDARRRREEEQQQQQERDFFATGEKGTPGATNATAALTHSKRRRRSSSISSQRVHVIEQEEMDVTPMEEDRTSTFSTTTTSPTTTTMDTETTTPPPPPPPTSTVEEDEEVEGATTIQIGTPLPTPNSLSPYSTSAQLLLKWCEAKALHQEMADVVEVDVLVPRRAPLAGKELAQFLREEEAKRLKEKEEEERRAMLREVELAKGRLRLNQEEDGAGAGGGVTSGTGSGTGASGMSGGGGATSATGARGAGGGTAVASNSGHGDANSSGGAGVSSSASASALGKKGSSMAGGGAPSTKRPKKKSRVDANLFLKYSKPCHMTFEVREEAVGIGQSDSIAKYGIGESIGRAGEVLEDDYGISVKPERFTDIVTGIDPTKYAGGSGRIGEEVLRRGLGFGSDGRPLLATGGGIPSAMRGVDGEVVGGDGIVGKDKDDGGESEEQALEAADLSEGKGIIRGRNGRPPIKVSTVPRRLEVLAEVAFIPLEGRVDARAARQSVRALQPRQVVILGGGRPGYISEEEEALITGRNVGDTKDASSSGDIVGEARLLADAVRSLSLGRGSIFAPADGETIELSVGHAAYSVRLVDTPYMTKEEKEAMAAAGEELPAFEPFEAKMGECTVSLLDCVATGQKVASDGKIVLAPRLLSENSRQPNVMLSDGDVLLTDLRSEVIAQGMKAEYSAHAGYSQLIVNGKVIVRKDQATGQINVEGPLCEDFFSVRSVVCGQYVTL